MPCFNLDCAPAAAAALPALQRSLLSPGYVLLMLLLLLLLLHFLLFNAACRPQATCC
jgi:hypothetical protein